jgi:excisionase family DNA binding protein
LETAMKSEKYGELRNEYPEYISLDQLYRICRICKRSALYLIKNGIIPSIDTGKKTWKYKILINDVIEYLRYRDRYGSMIPPGAVSSRTNKRTSDRKSFAYIVYPGQAGEIATYFKYIYAEYDDILTVNDVTDMTGLNKSTIQKMLRAGHIKSTMVRPKYLIPKQYLLEFVVTRKYIEARTKSEHFMKILGGFEIWKAAKS